MWSTNCIDRPGSEYSIGNVLSHKKGALPFKAVRVCMWGAKLSSNHGTGHWPDAVEFIYGSACGRSLGAAAAAAAWRQHWRIEQGPSSYMDGWNECLAHCNLDCDIFRSRQAVCVNNLKTCKTRWRMARERRGASYSAVSIKIML